MTQKFLLGRGKPEYVTENTIKTRSENYLKYTILQNTDSEYLKYFHRSKACAYYKSRFEYHKKFTPISLYIFLWFAGHQSASLVEYLT